jgi:hypothetical protein
MKKIEFAGFEGKGKTKAECMADIERQVRRATEGSFIPKLFQYHGEVGLIWRDPSGINSATFSPVDGTNTQFGLKMGGLGMHAAETSMADACKLMKLNLAQRHCDVGSDAVPSVIQDDPELIRQWMSWVAFQRAYRHAVAQRPWEEQRLESTRDAAHAWACDHCGEFFFNPVMP